MGIVNRCYVSEHTLWMREQLTAHPEWVEAQTSGRALWWDKLPDSPQLAIKETAKAYPYDVNFGVRS